MTTTMSNNFHQKVALAISTEALRDRLAAAFPNLSGWSIALDQDRGRVYVDASGPPLGQEVSLWLRSELPAGISHEVVIKRRASCGPTDCVLYQPPPPSIKEGVTIIGEGRDKTKLAWPHPSMKMSSKAWDTALAEALKPAAVELPAGWEHHPLDDAKPYPPGSLGDVLVEKLRARAARLEVELQRADSTIESVRKECELLKTANARLTADAIRRAAEIGYADGRGATKDAKSIASRGPRVYCQGDWEP